jgi:hypothetical protein
MSDALQRWTILVGVVNNRPLVGTPGVRDVDYPCSAFEPGEPTTAGECETDGHYMCNECTHRATCEGCGLRPVHCECELEEDAAASYQLSLIW